MTRPPRSPYWVLAAFVLFLAAPPWATTALVAAALASMAFRAARFLLSRRTSVGWSSRHGAATEAAIALGSDKRGRRVAISEQELSAHGLILGATGAGKTTTLLTILEEQIRRGRPVVAIDMKGSPSFARRLAEAAAAAQRPFKVWTPDGPSRWNPLQHGNPTELKDKLICTERFTEPHYQRAAERYLQNILSLLRHAHPERAPTLEEAVALMDPGRVPAALRGAPRPLTERIQDYLAGLTPDQRSAIRGLQTRLAIITESVAGQYLAPADGEAIDLRTALEGREVVLFSLNSNRYGQLAAQLGTLAVQDLICAAGSRLEEREDGRRPEQATIAIDEFSGIGGEHVIALFARGREAGIAVLVATQELADLERGGRAVRDQVLGNTAVKLVLRQDVPDSARLVAQIAGTETTWEETRQIGATILGGYPGRGTRRQVERFVVHPNEVGSLRTGEAVLISKLRGERAKTIRVQPPRRTPARGARRDRDGGGPVLG